MNINEALRFLKAYDRDVAKLKKEQETLSMLTKRTVPPTKISALAREIKVKKKQVEVKRKEIADLEAEISAQQLKHQEGMKALKPHIDKMEAQRSKVDSMSHDLRHRRKKIPQIETKLRAIAAQERSEAIKKALERATELGLRS